MPTARVDSVNLFFEEVGAGLPLVFVHEFAGDGYGSVPGDRAKCHADAELTARRFEADGMPKTADLYAKGPTRVQFMDKDPLGWREFQRQLAEGSALGHALTLRGVQQTRPSIFDLGAALEKLEVPTLIMTGDED